MALHTWSDAFTSGAATPALLLGPSAQNWMPLLARLVGPPGNKTHVLLIAKDFYAKDDIRNHMPMGLYSRMAYVTEEGFLKSCQRITALPSVVLWIGSAGRFSEESGAFDDVRSEDDTKILNHLLKIHKRASKASTLYVATCNPDHAVLPGCLLPGRMDGLAGDLLAAVVRQFNVPFQREPATASQTCLARSDFAASCVQDGKVALEDAAQ